MGLKLEIILIVLVMAILSLALSVRISNGRKTNHLPTIELEFKDMTLREVDTNKTMGVAYGTYGVRDKGILTIQNFKYQDDSIQLLRADTAIYEKEKIYLNNNVVFVQTEGQRFDTEHAEYDQKSEILDITSPFKTVIGKNIVHGDTLRYWMKNKEVYATNIDAIVYTEEK